jgi:hypothetical protein
MRTILPLRVMLMPIFRDSFVENLLMRAAAKLRNILSMNAFAVMKV